MVILASPVSSSLLPAVLRLVLELNFSGRPHRYPRITRQHYLQIPAPPPRKLQACPRGSLRGSVLPPVSGRGGSCRDSRSSPAPPRPRRLRGNWTEKGSDPLSVCGWKGSVVEYWETENGGWPLPPLLCSREKQRRCGEDWKNGGEEN